MEKKRSREIWVDKGFASFCQAAPSLTISSDATTLTEAERATAQAREAWIFLREEFDAMNEEETELGTTTLEGPTEATFLEPWMVVRRAVMVMDCMV